MKKVFLLAGSVCIAASALQARRPNIIYIMTDQQSANALGCAGNPDVRTPNIDRLAAHGVRFTNAYCAMPLSGPSRSAMFTGYMPKEIGVMPNGTPLPDSLRNRTLGSLMKNAGYETAYAGKWHAHTNSLPADTAFGFRNLHGHNDFGLAEDAIKFLREDHTDKPFFLVASFDNPHNICEYARGQKLPFATVKETSPDSCPNLPANFAVAPYDAAVLQWEKKHSYKLYPTQDFRPEDWRRYRHAYYSLVQHVDSEIGKIVDEIDRQNLWDNSVIIFTSDHGDGQGAHGWNQKTVLYEEVANIPFIVCLPGGKNAGATCEALVSNGIDLMPSVLDWAGVTVPEYCKGRSIRPSVEKPSAADGAEYVVVETEFLQTGGTSGWAVRTPRFKYVLYDAGKNREMLYDMENDRGEMRNLAIEARYKDELQRHRDYLREYMTQHYIGEEYPSTRLIPVD